MPALAFAAINIGESNFVTPWIIGRRLELSPRAVFLSVMLLGWLWEVAGAFIAVPFLVALRSAARRSKSLRIWTQFFDRGRVRDLAQAPIPIESLIRRRSLSGTRVARESSDSHLGTSGMTYDSGAEWRKQIEHFRALHRVEYGSADFDEFEPAYHYGWDVGRKEELRDQSWSDFESAMRVDWERNYPDGEWSRFQRAVQLGWDRAREPIGSDA